jgi:hypothetical protein
MGYLEKRKRWYQQTWVRLLFAFIMIYVLLVAALVLTPCR